MSKNKFKTQAQLQFKDLRARVTQELKNQVTKEAERQGISESDYIRMTIIKDLDKINKEV